MTLKGLKYYLRNPKRWYAFLASRGLLNWMSDEAYLKYAFRANVGRELDLKHPTTYNEKLQWLKIHNRKLEYTSMVDKYEAKAYIEKKIGSGYTIPTLGVWDRFSQINFDSLPEQFVLKCTHDSGGLVICKDKSKLNLSKVRKKINKCLKKNYYWANREWPYKDVKPRIIAEKYMEDTADDALTDYKFFCFGGEPKIMYISRDHGKEPRTDFFDMDFNHLPILARDPNAEITPGKPAQFEQMRKLAAVLSAGVPHLRVDFYIINGAIYVGELTFFHMSGLTLVKPEEWNIKMGEWIQLPIDQE